MFGANAMWGLMSPVVKLVLATGLITPLVMVDFRVAGAAALFWFASIFGKRKREHVPVKDLLLLAGAAMLGIVFNQGCFVVGINLTSPGEGSLFTTTMPMWVMLLAWVILHEPITLKKAGGIALGATGAIILVTNGSGHTAASGSNPMLGDLIVLTAQLSYALYLTLYRNFIRKYSLVTLMKWMFLFATVAMLPVTVGDLATIDWNALPWQSWAGIAYVVVGATFLAYICVMVGQKNLRPTIVGMYNYVQPIVAMVVGICLGLDDFTAIKAVAVVLIFGGVYLVTISKAAPLKDQ